MLACIAFRALPEGETLVVIRSALLADVQSQAVAVETDASSVVIARSGPALGVWALIGPVVVAVAAGSIAVVWDAIRER